VLLFHNIPYSLQKVLEKVGLKIEHKDGRAQCGATLECPRTTSAAEIPLNETQSRIRVEVQKSNLTRTRACFLRGMKTSTVSSCQPAHEMSVQLGNIAACSSVKEE
jgi:hypothetical protein